MDIFSLEEYKNIIIKEISTPTYKVNKVELFIKYYTVLLDDEEENYSEMLFEETFPYFMSVVFDYCVFYKHPSNSKKLFELLDSLYNSKIAINHKSKILELKQRLLTDFEILQSIINGEHVKVDIKSDVTFPVLEMHEDEIANSGFLEGFTLDIKKYKNVDDFLLIPSEMKIDSELDSQIKLSWNIAKEFVQQKKKRLFAHHQVIIKFNNAYGYYTCNSLGTALTLILIEKLLEFYNTSLVVNVKNNIAITGGLSKDGELLNVSAKSIEEKVVVVFFSNVETFVVPRSGEIAAKEKLIELNREFPNRKLKIVGVETLDDLLERRTLIEIKKQNPAVRTVKAIKKHWVSIVLLSVLLLLSGYFYVKDYDDKPALFEHNGNTLFVKNKFGKTLWTKEQHFPNVNYVKESYRKNYFRLIDIDNDGINEVLIATEIFPEDKIKEKGRITCYNFDGTERWNYYFKDTVKTQREYFTGNWNHAIMFDTATLDRRKILICSISNYPSFANAIFKLDLKTGKRLPGTFWHPGHCGNAFVKDLDSDGKQKLIHPIKLIIFFIRLLLKEPNIT